MNGLNRCPNVLSENREHLEAMCACHPPAQGHHHLANLECKHCGVNHARIADLPEEADESEGESATQQSVPVSSDGCDGCKQLALAVIVKACRDLVATYPSSERAVGGRRKQRDADGNYIKGEDGKDLWEACDGELEPEALRSRQRSFERNYISSCVFFFGGPGVSTFEDLIPALEGGEENLLDKVAWIILEQTAPAYRFANLWRKRAREHIAGQDNAGR